MEDLRRRRYARTWAEGIIATVAEAQSWPDEAIVAAAELVEDAWDQTPYVTNPIWGVISDTGPEFFQFLAELWPVSSTFPDSWNKLQAVWVSAAGAAAAQEEAAEAWWTGINEALAETGVDLKNTTAALSVGFSAGGLVVGLALLWLWTKR